MVKPCRTTAETVVHIHPPAQMKIEMWPIARPVPYARNPRKISQEAIDRVAASIWEFGWRQPIVCDKNDIIIVGHTRLLAAQKLKISEVPVHVADNLSEAQIKAYRIADNRTGEFSAWDDELLKLEVDDLRAVDFDVDMIGLKIDKIVENQDIPKNNKEIDEHAMIETKNECPKCGFKW